MTKAFDCALRLLVRREHGETELTDKLLHKGYDHHEVNEAVAQCQRLGLQSDIRFAESLCRVRIRQGYGPIKISHELQTKKIARELIDTTLEAERDNWLSYALAVWHKKYTRQDDLSFAELQKQQRFLLYRGFPTDIITKVIRAIDLCE